MSHRKHTPEATSRPPEAKEQRTAFTFRDREDAEQYFAWKQFVPREVRDIVEGTMTGASLPETFTPLPLTNQFLRGFASGIRNPEAREAFSDLDWRVRQLLDPLANIKTQEGFLNAYKVLPDPALSWSFRTNLYHLQIKSSIEWLVSQDLKAMRKEGEKQKLPPSQETGQKHETPEPPSANDVPPSSEEVRSSMESGMEKREGEPTALFAVRPFYGGYYKQLVFDRFDPTTLRWEKPDNELHEPEAHASAPVGKRVLLGKARRGTPLAIPLPYDWICEPDILTTPDTGGRLMQNQDGQWYLELPGTGVGAYAMTIAQKEYREEGAGGDVRPCVIAGALPHELAQQLAEVKASPLQPLARARALTRIIRDSLEYSNDPAAYADYTADSQKFFEKIWATKKADCHVANTFAARALTEAGIACRFIGGHFVKEKGEKDEAILHAGNGHAWLEVYDTVGMRWVRLDATPKGDPTVDEAVQEQDLSGEGDFGENDREIASTEEVKKKIRELQKQGGGKRATPEYQRSEEQFAHDAECTESQAREFLRALERVREIKDERGTPIVELLIAEWKKIVQEYVLQQSDYRGPVRMDEGDRLEDPVAARIDIAVGEYNPTGFEKIVSVEKVQAEFGGINMYFSFDLSGSMTESDPVSGRSKADVQRDAGLLFVDSLMQCAFVARQMASQEVSLPVKIMVTVASGSGRVQLPLTDRWTPKEQWLFYTALAQTVRGGTPIHETLAHIERAHDVEVASLQNKKIPKEKQPIHYTVELTDGIPDDVSAVCVAHARMQKKGMAVRAYVIGENPPENYGASAEPVESFSAVPALLAKDIVSVFQKLKPTRVKRTS